MELLDQLLAGRYPRELFGKDGSVDELKNSLLDQVLNTDWLGDQTLTLLPSSSNAKIDERHNKKRTQITFG